MTLLLFFFLLSFYETHSICMNHGYLLNYTTEMF